MFRRHSASVTFDKKLVTAAYVRIRKGASQSQEVSDAVVVCDYDEDGRLLGFEVFGAKFL
jgi:uncharacterized protein YuzE